MAVVATVGGAARQGAPASSRTFTPRGHRRPTRPDPAAGQSANRKAAPDRTIVMACSHPLPLARRGAEPLLRGAAALEQARRRSAELPPRLEARNRRWRSCPSTCGTRTRRTTPYSPGGRRGAAWHPESAEEMRVNVGIWPPGGWRPGSACPAEEGPECHRRFGRGKMRSAPRRRKWR